MFKYSCREEQFLELGLKFKGWAVLSESRYGSIFADLY
jgi:hypothetical protein